MHVVNPKLSDRIYQIVKGTVLGGSSLTLSKGSKNCYLSMRSKDENWLQYKSDELKTLSSLKPFTLEKTNRWHSLCYPLLSEIKNLLYNNKTRIIKEGSLDDLKDIAYMIWFGDCGSCKRGIITLNTHIWGEENTHEIIKYFNESGFNCLYYDEYGKSRIKFDKKSSSMILKIISPHFPHFFKL